MHSLQRFWASRTIRLLLISLCCVALPFIVTKVVEQKRKNSVLWLNAGGFDDRAKAERASLQKLGQMVNENTSTNLLWARYTLSISDSDGEVLGLRLAAIGYNREKQSLIDSGIDPNLITRDIPPTKYDIYAPVSPADIAQLVRQKGRVADIRQVVPNVRMRTRVVPYGEKYDETMLP